jgi:hypothetical protein
MANLLFNVKVPTDLCEIMGRHQSDKGNIDINRSHHNYTTLYHHLFKDIRYDEITLFELGLGTNNPDIPSSMGIWGTPCASVRGWAEYFPKGQIYGADIDKDILITTDRIKTFYCDQRDPTVINQLFETLPMFDIIIEDGLHELEAHITFFENTIHRMKKNGYFIIEDIHINYIDQIKEQIKLWEKRYPDLLFDLQELSSETNTSDNNVLLVRHKLDITKIIINAGQGIGNTMKTFISCLSINDNTRIQCAMCGFGEYFEMLDNRFIMSMHDERQNVKEFKLNVWRMYVLKSEEEFQENLDIGAITEPDSNFKDIFSNSTFIDGNYDRSLICDQVYNRLVSAIRKIKFLPNVYKELDKYVIDYPNALAISIRTWTGEFDIEVDDRKYSFDIYIDAITDQIKKHQVKTIVMSIDNEEHASGYLNYFNHFFPGISIVNLGYYNKLSNVQRTLMKVLILSKCNYFVCSRTSTFSELVYWFSECKQIVTPLF